MRVSISAYIPEHGTHLFCYNYPAYAHEETQTAICRLRQEFGNPQVTTHGTKNRQRICWDFKGGARLVKTIQ